MDQGIFKFREDYSGGESDLLQSQADEDEESALQSKPTALVVIRRTLLYANNDFAAGWL